MQIVPMKLPSRPVVDFSYGFSYYSTATGKTIPLSPLGSRDVWGFDNGARALPSAFPDNKIVRQRHLHARRRLRAGRRSPRSAGCSATVAAGQQRTASRGRTGAPRSATGSAISAWLPA